jgi:serine/threonine-protein kinase
VYAAAVVLWETLTGQRLFRADDAGAVIAAVLESVVPPASTIVAGLSLELDAAIARALAPSPDARFATALEFAAALEEAAGPPAPQREVAEWVNSAGGARLAARRDLLMAVEQTPTDGPSGEVSALNGQPRSRAEVRAASEAATMVVPAAESATAAGGELQAQPLRTIPASRPSSRQFGITAGIVLAGLALFGLVAARTRHRHPVAAERTAPPPSALVTAAAPASSGEAIESDASDAPTPPAASRPVSSHVAVHVAPHIAGSARKPTTPDNCDPAFTFDSAGVKHFKPRCL